MKMFSENNRISVRQAVRNYGMMVISISALVIPVAMNHTAMPSVLLAAGLLGVYLAGMAAAAAPENRIFQTASYVHGWILGTLTARMTGLLVQEFLLNGVPLWGILILFYAMCYYNLYKGLECRMRVGEILFLPFLLLLAGLAIAMHGEAEVIRIREFTWILDKNGIWKGYELFCWLTAVQGLWSLRNHMTEKKTAVGRVWLLGTAGVVFWALFTFFIYGDAGHTGLVFPLASAMTLAHLPGNVIGRLDSIFVFVWVIGLFTACSTLFAPLQAEEPDRRKKYLFGVLLAASLAFACQEKSQELLSGWLYWISTPVQMVLFIWQFLAGNGKKMLLTGLGFLCMLLTGCGHQELEKENLTESICVDVGTEKAYTVTFGFYMLDGAAETYRTEADSLKEARNMYDRGHEKNLDFNHLKNFYFSENLMEEEVFGNLLMEIQTDGTYSRGISVWVTDDDPAKAVEMKEQPEEGTPVHRMLNAWYNRESFRPYSSQKK